MVATPNHFDAYLESINADQLKRMARLWGGDHKMRKVECIELIRESLHNPLRVRAAIETLIPLEHNAMALMNYMGGQMDARVLAIGLRAAGVGIPRVGQARLQNDMALLVDPLINRGLILRTYSGYGSYYSSLSSFATMYGGAQIFSDPRLLVYAPRFPQCEPLKVQPGPHPSSVLVRRPQTVLLDILGILQAVATMGGIGLTQSNTVRVSDIRKLARAMNWSGEVVDIDGQPFHEPALAFAAAMSASGLLTLQGKTVRLAEAPEAFAARSYAEQISPLVRGFLHSAGWNELGDSARSDSYATRRLEGRMALLLALAALPTDTDGFFALDDLDQALFERVGETFSLGYLPSRPLVYRDTPKDEQRRQEQEWQNKLRRNWRDNERAWFRASLTSWIFALGLVELGYEGETVVSVRLTDLGQLILHPGQAVKARGSDNPPQHAWVVQPTFDIVVYLDQSTPQQLAFLERHAERVQIGQHTAQYRLTREAVYQGLEQGTSLSDILAELRAGAAMDLPQNVAAELGSWAALRERITVHRQSRLVEFPTPAARDAALQGNLEGVAVGERMVLLSPAAALPSNIKRTIDYARPLPQCLKVSEDGAIELRIAQDTAPDLLIVAQLDKWATRQSDWHWQLTADSIAAALHAKADARELFDLLDKRSVEPVPPLLIEVLRSWTGTPMSVGLANVTVLQCARPELLAAMEKSKTLRPAIRGRLGPDVLLVDSQAVEALRKYLTWAGITINETIRTPPGR